MNTSFRSLGLHARRYRARAYAESGTLEFDLTFAGERALADSHALLAVQSADRGGRLCLKLETDDHVDKYSVCFSENRLFFWGAANIGGEQCFIEGETEASFRTLLGEKPGPIFTLGTVLEDGMIYPVYYLGDEDITDATAATVDYRTWVTTVQKSPSPFELNPTSFLIDIDYCGENFTGTMTADDKAITWTGERIEEEFDL